MKNKKITEITQIIEKKIKNYHLKPENTKKGRVISVGDGIVLAKGLEDVGYLETVIFDSGAIGIVFLLEENSVGIILLNKVNTIKENDGIKTTNKLISVSVNEKYIGRIIDPLGNILDDGVEIEQNQFEVIEKIAPGVIKRKSVDEPIETGILIIDALIPIGKGQRELLIGDRQTGKTSLVVDTIINQKGKNVICIYVAIGQKSSSILEVVSKFKKHGAMDYTIIVSASASVTEGMKYIAPFSGMTLAEFFMKKGKDVLIVFDDLTKHAIAYRSLSLLLCRSPGREAYPGDIFYLHSRLLERAVKLDEKFGGGSITALPIVETQLEDISAYIPTNIISITDGQIFLINDLFNLGVRPAIDLGLSVSRVGSSAQNKFIKQMIGSLKLDISQYRELESFSRFGGSLDKITIEILERGKKIIEILKQKEISGIPQWIMSIILFTIKKKIIKQIDIKNIKKFRDDLQVYFEKLSITGLDWIQKIIKTKEITEYQELKLLQEINKFILEFNKKI